MASRAVAGVSRSVIIWPANSPQFLLLNLPILELAEAVLQALQVLDRALVRLRLEQRREELQQVAQLLAALAQVVQPLGGRVGA